MHIQWPMISDRDHVDFVPPQAMDQVWASGWRHFGRDFFRDSATIMNGCLNRVIPLRIRLNNWAASKSQRRTVKKNQGFRSEFSEIRMGEEERNLFNLHKERFSDNVPEGLENFLGEFLDDYPCECLQFSVYDNTRLIACSYLDLGEESVSSVYGMFDPKYSKYGLGIFTMLEEIKYALDNGYKYYYSGYATIEPSAYDYKKSFNEQEFFSWTEWKPMDRLRLFSNQC